MMLNSLFARIKEDRRKDADQLARFNSGRMKFSELRDGKWIDISAEVVEDLKRKIIEADAILQQAGQPREHWPSG
jgi:hypothetical protein